MKEKKCCFIGPKQCCHLDKAKVEAEIKKIIEMGVEGFYSIGAGEFDNMCGDILNKFKKSYKTLSIG